MALISLGCNCEPDCPPINGTPGPPGPRGKTGIQGLPGIDGLNAFGVTTAPFVMPAVGAGVLLSVNPALWATPNQIVYVMEVGYFKVVTTSTLSEMWLANLGYPGNSRPGSSIGAGRQVSPAGYQGEQGEQGIQGERGPQGLRGKRGKHGKRGPQGEPGPQGPKGDTGTGFYFKGEVTDTAALPATGNEVGDCYVTTDTGHAWVWDGYNWVDIGTFRGPPGEDGKDGQDGKDGDDGLHGDDGAPGIPAYTYSLSDFTVPPVGGYVSVDVVETSWAAVGEWVWIEGADSPGTAEAPWDGGTSSWDAGDTVWDHTPAMAGQMQITAISGNRLTLYNSPHGIIGTPGPAGPPGPPGLTGKRGSLWFTGSGPAPDPPPTNALPQDLYLDVTNGDIWVLTGTRFRKISGNN